MKGTVVRGWNARDRIPKPPFDDFGLFKEGLAELRTINPDLKFWGHVDESAKDWPAWAKDKTFMIKAIKR